MATLQDILLKVRRMTKSPSQNQITDQQIEDYVNTFYIYDFPEHLRTFNLRQNLTFVTYPNVDTYDFPVGNPISFPNTSIGSIAGSTFTTNLFSLFGFNSDVNIIPGSVNILVNSPGVATFEENFPYTGLLTGTGAGTNGLIDYFGGNLTLNFSSSISSSAASISFQYAYPEWLTVTPPLYIAGYESQFTQSQSEFYRLYPKITTLQQVAVGQGITGPYQFTLQNIPVLQNNVLIDAVDTNAGTGQSVRDDGLGNLFGDGTGTVNYVTGVCSVTFNNSVNTTSVINSQTVPYVPNRPACALFFADKFVLRPVPDQAYTVEIEGYKRPTALMAIGQMPELAEWWQYIATGAAMKIFEDRGDFASIQQYTPIFKEYQAMVLRRTIVQQTNDRTQTIYTEMTHYGFGNFLTPF